MQLHTSLEEARSFATQLVIRRDNFVSDHVLVFRYACSMVRFSCFVTSEYGSSRAKLSFLRLLRYISYGQTYLKQICRRNLFKTSASPFRLTHSTQTTRILRNVILTIKSHVVITSSTTTDVDVSDKAKRIVTLENQ